MAVNRGKQFEKAIRDAFQKVHGVSIDRLPDQMTGYKKTSSNICDFIVYKYPHQYYIECKSVHGNTFPFSNVTETQWQGLLRKSKLYGVYAGIICWWVDYGVTKFIPIQALEWNRKHGFKSLRYDYNGTSFVEIKGKKKRVLYEYDMEGFFNDL